jgi:hypothetical protein
VSNVNLIDVEINRIFRKIPIYVSILLIRINRNDRNCQNVEFLNANTIIDPLFLSKYINFGSWWGNIATFTAALLKVIDSRDDTQHVVLVQIIP